MIHDFFFEYQDNELLGKIDNAALILADKSPYLARDPRCLELSVKKKKKKKKKYLK
jgi:hypothetical protein